MNFDLIAQLVALTGVTAFILLTLSLLYQLYELKRNPTASVPVLSWIDEFDATIKEWEMKQSEAKWHAQKIFEKICEDEGIPLNYVDDTLIDKVTGEKASGHYVYRSWPRPTEGREEWIRAVRIDIVKGKYQVMTLAHEIGHHFCLKLHGDGSEESANKYIRTLFDTYVPKEYTFYLEQVINIWADIKNEKGEYYSNYLKFYKQAA